MKIQSLLEQANRVLKESYQTQKKIQKMNIQRMRELAKIHSQLYTLSTKTADLQTKKKILRQMNTVRQDRQQLLKQVKKTWPINK